MVRVGHVRQNLVRERVSGFGRLAVAKIDRAFGRAGRASRRAHRESARPMLLNRDLGGRDWRRVG